MKKTITLLFASFIFFSAFSQQQPKHDSLILEIRMDSATWKHVTNIIRESIVTNPTYSINGQLSETGKTILSEVLVPLYQYRFVPNEQPKQPADKPKEIKPKQ